MSQEHFITGEQENTKSEPKKGVLDPVLDNAAAVSQELLSLARELRGLARKMKAGEIPSARRIAQIGRWLNRCDGEFNALVGKIIRLVASERRAGFNEGFHAIPINDEPFKSAFGALFRELRSAELH